MNDAKYVGMDVHTATIYCGGSGFERKSGDGGHHRNKSRNYPRVCSWSARQSAGELRRRNLCLLVARSFETSRQRSVG